MVEISLSGSGEGPGRKAGATRPEKPEAIDRRLATEGNRPAVVKLEEAALATAHARLADERALLAIAVVHRAPDLGGAIPRIGAGRATPAGARPRGGTELLSLQLREQRVEREIEDLGEVARRHQVARQGPGPHDLLLHCLIDRALQGEPLRRERRHPGGGWRCVDWPRGQRQYRRSGLRRLWLEPGRHVRPRAALGEKDLDLGLALVARRGDELIGVVGRQVRRQEKHAAHVQPTVRNGAEDLRAPLRGTGGADALPGGVLA